MTTTDSAVEYTREELVSEIERGAQALGISAAELATAYRTGNMPVASKAPDLIALLNLLPENDPLFEGK